MDTLDNQSLNNSHMYVCNHSIPQILTWCKGSGEGDIGSLLRDTDRLTLDTAFHLDVGNLAHFRPLNEETCNLAM